MGKLEALKYCNASHKNLLKCGLGSLVDQTKNLMVSGLGKKLKDMMNDFQGLRAMMQLKYKEIIKCRYFTITGEKANEKTIDNLILSKESKSSLQKAIQEQQKG